MLKLKATLALFAALGVIWCAPALAYIGPGAGISVLGALWGVVVAIVLTIGAVVIWPFKILLRRFRKRPAKPADEAVAKTSEAESGNAEQNRALSSKKSG